MRRSSADSGFEPHLRGVAHGKALLHPHYIILPQSSPASRLSTPPKSILFTHTTEDQLDAAYTQHDAIVVVMAAAGDSRVEE